MDTKSTFDREAEEYDYNSRAVNIYFDEALDELVNNIQPVKAENLQVLDVCCGTGILTEKVAKKFPGATIFGVDFSEGMTAVAKRRMKDFDFKVIICDICDSDRMKTLPMFDVVVSSFGIHNVHGKPNKQTALNNIIEHLKPGGQIILCDILKGRDAVEQQHFDDFQRQYIRKTYSAKATEEWMNLLAEEDSPETLQDNFKLLSNSGCTAPELLWQKEFLAIWQAKRAK